MDLIIYIYFVVVFIAGVLFGRFTCKLNNRKYVATLIIDPVNPEVNGGVYTLWEKMPHEMVKNGELKDHQLITMEVLISDVARKAAESQQNQGT